MLNLDADQLLPKTLDQILEGSTIGNDIAEVRLQHYMNKRRTNILRVHDYLGLTGIIRNG